MGIATNLDALQNVNPVQVFKVRCFKPEMSATGLFKN